jgi:hypothetical protein
MEYSGAGGKLIHKKKQKQKISWHCPFKVADNSFEIWSITIYKLCYAFFQRDMDGFFVKAYKINQYLNYRYQ